MAVVNKFNVNKQEVTLDADIIENMSANDVSYDASFKYDENTVGDKLSELGTQVYELNTYMGLDSSIEFISNSQNAKFDLPLKVGQIVTITNLASINCSVHTFGDSDVAETIISPLAPNESIEYTIKKEASRIGGYIDTAPYHIKIESKLDGLIQSVESLVECQKSLTKADFNNDGFLVRMGYDKGSSFIIGKTTSELTLKCALYASKSGTTYLKGFYNINTTISLDNSKFSFVILNLNSGEISVSNSDESVYDEGIVVLLTMTPTKHLAGHLAPWAYSKVDNAKTSELYNKNKESIDEIKTVIEGTTNITEFNSPENNARFDFPLSAGQTIRITNQGSIACSADTFNDLGIVEIIQSPIGVGETVEFTATKNATKIGGYIDTPPYSIKVETLNNDGLSQRVETIEEKQKQATGADIYFQFHGHPFYSHMLIDKQNSSQIIPCMSLYDVNMAARMGFKFIEPSGAITSDGVYLVNHMVAKTIDGVSKLVFAGGCKYKGTDNPADDFAVNEKTAAWIRENVCYYSKYKKYESFIPTLEEFCLACKQNNIGVFLSAMREEDIEMALSIIGPDNLIIYSGDITKLKGWRSKYNNITFMYYDTTKNISVEDALVNAKSIGKPLLYEVDVPSFRNMADETMKDFVCTMHKNGFLVGCAACYMNESEVRKAIKFGFDVFASGGHMNEFVGNTIKQIGDVDFSDFKQNGSIETVNSNLVMQDKATLQGGDVSESPKIYFFLKSLLRIKFKGTLKIWMSGVHSNTYTVTSDGNDYEFFSDLGIETSFSLWITSVGETTIHSIEYHGSVC